MKNIFGSEDKIKVRKLKLPIDFEDSKLNYTGTNNFDMGEPKKRMTTIIKKKSTGVKAKQPKGKNDLF